MKKTLFILALLFQILQVEAQQVIISMQIKDAYTKKPVAFADLTFLQKDSLVAHSITNEQGFADIPINRGKYKLIVHKFGYINDTINNMIISTDGFTDVFKIMPDEQQLQAVTVKTQSRRIEIDREVQIVTEKMRNGAANSFDVLDKVNGIFYDRYQQKIKVDNDDNVMLLVNGIEKDNNYIKNLNPDRILKVEIIRDPGGKYGLRGYSAVVNIILKSTYVGTDINANSFFIANFFNRPMPVLPFYFGNVTLNYVNRKINLYAEYSPHGANFVVDAYKTRIYNDGSQIVFSEISPDIPSGQMQMQSHNLTLGADWYISPKQSLSYETNFRFSPASKQVNYEKFAVQFYDANHNKIRDLTSLSTTETESKEWMSSLTYITKFNADNELNVNYNFSVLNQDIESFVEFDTVKTLQNTSNSRQLSDFSFEYSHNFNKKFGIIVGYGNIYKSMQNNFITTDGGNQNYVYSDFRNNAYAYFSYVPNKKTGLKAGLGFENVLLNSGSFKKTMTVYEPYFDLKYSPLKFLTLKLKYRSHVNYPSVNQLNPFVQVVDFQNFSMGNPGLTPEWFNKISFKLAVAGGLLSVEPYYQFSNNAIISIRENYDKVPGTFITTFRNAAQSTEKGIRTNFVIPFGKTIFANTGITFYKQSMTYNGETHTLNDWLMNSMVMYNNQKLSLQAGIMYQKNLFSHLTWQGYNTMGNDFWSILIQKSFFKQKLNLMFLYVLPVNFGVNYYQTTYLKTYEMAETSTVDLKVLKNMMMFNIAYRFSRGRDAKRINHKTETKDKKINQQGFFSPL